MNFRNQIFLFCMLFVQSLVAQPIWEKRFTGVELGTDKLYFADAYFHAIEIEHDLLVIDTDTGLPTCRLTNCGQDAMGIIPSMFLARTCPLLKIAMHRGYAGFVPLPPKEEDAKRFPIITNKIDPTIFRVRLLRQPSHGRVDSSVSVEAEVALDHPSLREYLDFCKEQQGDRLKM